MKGILSLCAVVLACAAAILLATSHEECVATKSTPCPVKQEEPKIGRAEAVYDGYVRSIHFQNRTFLYESTSGYVKVVGPLCGSEMLPVWEGMHVSVINFHWKQPDQESGCFSLDYVEHSQLGDAKPAPAQAAPAPK